jgi:predicted nucleic acid-binding protein
MIVVADSSPLHYLILIEQVGLLRHLYSEVVVPEAVRAQQTRFARGSEWLVVDLATVASSGAGERGGDRRGHGLAGRR